MAGPQRGDHLPPSDGQQSGTHNEPTTEALRAESGLHGPNLTRAASTTTDNSGLYPGQGQPGGDNSGLYPGQKGGAESNSGLYPGQNGKGDNNSGMYPTNGDGANGKPLDVGGGFFNRVVNLVDGNWVMTGNRSFTQLNHEQQNLGLIQGDLGQAYSDFQQGNNAAGVHEMEMANKAMGRDPNLEQQHLGLDLHMLHLHLDGYIPIWGGSHQSKYGEKLAQQELKEISKKQNDISIAVQNRSQSQG